MNHPRDGAAEETEGSVWGQTPPQAAAHPCILPSDGGRDVPLTQQLGVPEGRTEQTTLRGSPKIVPVAAAGASTWSMGTMGHLAVPTMVT